jgi:hypothetical protein
MDATTTIWRGCLLALAGAMAVSAEGASIPDVTLALEYQWFAHEAEAADYAEDQLLQAAVTWDHLSQDGKWRLDLDAYVAHSRRDDERSRADLRSLSLVYYADRFDIKVGVATEFWGVTESRHLVDIINQTSVVDNLDEEIKLGQPMIKWQTHQDWGNLQLFWLPVFRDRLFPAAGARLSPGLPVDGDTARYASGAERKHQDLALRYAHTLGDWDLGLSYFRGTSRDPLLDVVVNTAGQWVLSPYYEQIEQQSLDLQRTREGLLLKLEAIQRHGSRQGNYHALVTGFEYTQNGLFGTAADLGYIVEYLYDKRGPTANTPFQDDVFAGLRLAFNNIGQTTLLLGMYQDLPDHSQVMRLELDTRLRDNLELSLEGQVFSGVASTDLLYDLRNDDYLRATLRLYF